MEFHANNRLSLATDLVTWYDRQNHVSATTPASSKRVNNRLTLS
jgi:hypothetical protein